MLMKIKIDLELEDFLEEDFDFDEVTNTLRLKDECEMKNTITQKIVDYITQNICWSLKINPNDVIDKFIKENKQEIISKVVNKVSNKIIVTKQIKDFKESIMEI